MISKTILTGATVVLFFGYSYIFSYKESDKAIFHEHNHIPEEQLFIYNPQPAYTTASSYSGSINSGFLAI